MTQIYYAGPLFTDAERLWNTTNAKLIEQAVPGARVLLPQDFCPPPPDFAAIFHSCVDHLARADLVVAIVDGADPDSGTCWEAGYAYAKHIPVISLRTDWRPAEDDGGNCMLRRSCQFWCTDLDQVIAAIGQLIAKKETHE